MRMKRSWGIRGGIAVVGAAAMLALALAGYWAEGAQWSRKYISRLPDSAFAVVEQAESGKAVRRLPHHDADGRLDLPHLCNAWARLKQVKWRDPANAEPTRRHLEAHLAEVGKGACRPPRKK
jgi:hypothetical protein